MPITTLSGTREDMIILQGLIEKYFKSRQKDEYIPEDMKCKVVYFLWPVKAFTIHMSINAYSAVETVSFTPNIQEFAEGVEDLISEMVEALEKQMLEKGVAQNIQNN